MDLRRSYRHHCNAVAVWFLALSYRKLSRNAEQILVAVGQSANSIQVTKSVTRSRGGTLTKKAASLIDWQL